MKTLYLVAAVLLLSSPFCLATFEGSPILVVNGGTQMQSATPYSVIVGGTTSTAPFQSLPGIGVGGSVLTSNGSGAIPSWVAPAIVSSVVATYYVSNPSNITPGANNPINFDSVIKDVGCSGSCVTTGASWKFTAPKTANYQINAVLAGGSMNVLLYKNGTLYLTLQQIGPNSLIGGNGLIISLSANDYIDLRPSNGNQIYGDPLGSSFASMISISMTSGGTNISNQGTGSVSMDAAQITCSSSSSVLNQVNSSTWVTAAGNISSGSCAITISGYTATPYCWGDLNVTSGTNQELVHFSASSSTSANLSCTDNGTIGTACTSFTANVFCLGTH